MWTNHGSHTKKNFVNNMRIDLGNETTRNFFLIKMVSHLDSYSKREYLAKFRQYLLMLMRLLRIDVNVRFIDVPPDLLNDLQEHDLKLCWYACLQSCDLFFCWCACFQMCNPFFLFMHLLSSTSSFKHWTSPFKETWWHLDK